MAHIKSNVDLGASFETLKKRMKIAESKKLDDSAGYAEAYGFLRSAVANHIYECTGESIYSENIPAADPNDIAQVNI